MTPEQLDAELAIFSKHCKRHDIISNEFAADLWPAWHARAIHAHQREAELTAEIARLQDQQSLLDWAVSRWNAEVANRPIGNKHRRTLDDVWRQVITFAGGDVAAIVGPSHDDLVQAEQPCDGMACVHCEPEHGCRPKPAPAPEPLKDELTELTAMSQELGVGYGQDDLPIEVLRILRFIFHYFREPHMAAELPDELVPDIRALEAMFKAQGVIV